MDAPPGTSLKSSPPPQPKIFIFTTWPSKHGFLTKAGLAINRIFLMHINPDYVLAGEIDPQRFFIKIDVTAQVSQLISDVGDNISAMQEDMV